MLWKNIEVNLGELKGEVKGLEKKLDLMIDMLNKYDQGSVKVGEFKTYKRFDFGFKSAILAIFSMLFFR